MNISIIRIDNYLHHVKYLFMLFTSLKQLRNMAKTRRLLLVLLPLRRKRLVKLMVIIITLFTLYQTFTASTEGSMPLILKFPASNLDLNSWGTSLYSDRKLNLSGLNAHVWYDICPTSIQAICHHPLFPEQPNERIFAKQLSLTRDQSNYIQRIFGFLHPPKTGKYRFAIASDDMSELWLSSSEDPSKAVLICKVDEWVPRGEFRRKSSQVSSIIELHQHRKYYLEILHGQLGGSDFLDVTWNLPGTETLFKRIDMNNTSLFVNDSNTSHNYNTKISSAACESRPHLQHKKNNSGNPLQEYLSHQTVANVLPYCNYTPSYLTKMEINADQTQNVYKFLSSHYFPVESFPPLEYENVANTMGSNHELDVFEAQKAARLFIDSLHQHYPGQV